MTRDFIADSGFIGQKATRRLLNFYIERQNDNGFIKPLFFAAERGAGKTKLARITGDHLFGSDKKRKKFIEVNGSTIQKLDAFVDDIIIPHVNTGQCTLFIDEIHSVSRRVMDFLLSVLQLSTTNQSRAFYDGIEYRFNFHDFSFISASTNPEKLPMPLKSRLKRVELEKYTTSELIQILKRHTPEIEYKENVENDIISHSRGCPRVVAEDIAKDIMQCGKKQITKSNWDKLKHVLGYKPFGLTTKEIQTLRFLRDCGNQSLTSLAAFLGLDPTTVRRDIELYLLSNGLIKIMATRHLTQKGLECLNVIDES